MMVETGETTFCREPETEIQPTKPRVTVAVLCLALFSTNLVSSMCAPFYPTSAERHGIESYMTGAILGVYYAATVLASPIMAIIMTRIGQPMLLQIGLILVGSCSLIFGGIDRVENTVIYGVGSFTLRALQGVGCAASDTAVFAIVSSRFTRDLARVNSYLNSCVGISFMIGPPLGGLVYEWSNFTLPFVISAALCFTAVFLVSVVLRKQCSREGSEVLTPSEVFAKSWYLLSNIRFLWIVVTTTFGCACTSFLDPTLSPYLTNQGFNNTAEIGVFYLIRDIAFTLGTPPVGTLIDMWKWDASVVLALGTITAGLGYVFVGMQMNGPIPVHYVGLRVCVSLVLIGVGQAPVFSATLPAMVEEATALDFKRNDQFCGILAALQNFAFYGGLWAGSVVGGAVTYYFGFFFATLCFGCLVMSVAVSLILIHSSRRKKVHYQSIENLDLE